VLLPSVPMLVMMTSSVALANVEAARASSSAVVFVRRRKDLTPEIFCASVTPGVACQKVGLTTENTEDTEGEKSDGGQVARLLDALHR
jgi:hypothetical protein